MLNFFHKPCCADSEKAFEISENIKNKSKIFESSLLENLLKLRIGTQKIQFKKMDEFIDFPKYTEDEMVEKIFYGTYYIQQSKSYLADILRNENFALIDKKILHSAKIETNTLNSLIQKLENSKIIGMEILSRHRRSLKKQTNKKLLKNYKVNYKVFIQFKNDSVEGIYNKSFKNLLKSIAYKLFKIIFAAVNLVENELVAVFT